MSETTQGVCYWYSTLNTEISRLHTPNIKFHKNLFHTILDMLYHGEQVRDRSKQAYEILLFVM